jgi:hypothetical protein
MGWACSSDGEERNAYRHIFLWGNFFERSHLENKNQEERNGKLRRRRRRRRGGGTG